MRNLILGSIVAASLGAPALAFAAPTTGPNTTRQPTQPPRAGSLGGGMQGGNEPGHVTGPGNAPIDNSSRGPINDVTPGQGSADTRQSKNPKPVR